MPSIRKLTLDEVQERKHGKLSKRALVSREYDEMLGQFRIGDWGEVVVDPNEKRLTIRNRLQAAAERKRVKLRFFRTQGPVIRFEVKDPESADESDADDDEEYLPQPSPGSDAGDDGDDEDEAVFLPAPALEAATQGGDGEAKRGPGRPRKPRAEGDEGTARKRPSRSRSAPAESES